MTNPNQLCDVLLFVCSKMADETNLSYIFDRQLHILLATIFTAVMLALVTEALGLPGWVSSSTENFPALRALTHLKTVHTEMV